MFHSSLRHWGAQVHPTKKPSIHDIWTNTKLKDITTYATVRRWYAMGTRFAALASAGKCILGLLYEDKTNLRYRINILSRYHCR